MLLHVGDILYDQQFNDCVWLCTLGRKIFWGCLWPSCYFHFIFCTCFQNWMELTNYRKTISI